VGECGNREEVERWFQGFGKAGHLRSMAAEWKNQPVTIFGCEEGEGQTRQTSNKYSLRKRRKRRVFIRVHPAGFLQLWGRVVRLAKVQKTSCNRGRSTFELVALRYPGPELQKLMFSLWQHHVQKRSIPSDSPQNIWKDFNILTNPSSLPANTLLLSPSPTTSAYLHRQCLYYMHCFSVCLAQTLQTGSRYESISSCDI